jgi:hypothetical protein
MNSLDEMDQLGLDELLVLMRRHERHLRAYASFFANFNRYLQGELELWPVLGEETHSQIDMFGDQFLTVLRLQDQITNTLLDLAEILISQQIN